MNDLRTLAKPSKQVFCTIALLLGLCALGTAPAHGTQLIEGMTTLKAFRIEFNNRIIGRVVVVGRDNPNPPPGYTAGQEYWTWRPGAAWRGAFTLVPVNSVPDFYAHTWERFPHEHFDLSHTVPMPSIAPDPGDGFYRVQVRSDSGWINQGWMWLMSGTQRKQEWYGRNLTSDLVGAGTAIRFTSVEPPAPGSQDVYLLIH